ncbi:MAG TPA: hypothetical protein VK668_11605 [Mucilaginibacter sp.]|nr:hypothetical protein [Mucilaginibacter sp.]
MKRRLLQSISITILLGALCFNDIARAQGIDTLETRIKTSLADHYKKYPQEKIFLHTDKGIYISGQIIWYKDYITAYGKPSQLSKIMYVQLTDEKGNVIIKNKLPLKDGLSHGNINLPDNLPTGWYQLRSFTTWMLNFGEDGFYHQQIYIQNRTDNAEKIAGKKSDQYHITFFPEGGDLVEGNLCNIAFKATDGSGLPVKIDGEVLDNTQKVIAKLATVHDGMGLFRVEGYAGKKNKAIVHFPDNSVQDVELPEFKKAGITMQVNNSSVEQIGIKISFTNELQQSRNVVIAAFQNNGLINTYPLQLNRGINNFRIKKSDFATGILRLTLFTASGLPQAERLVFINKNDQLQLALNADTLSHQPKSRSVFKLSSKAGQGAFAPGHFSVSVTDADMVDDNLEDHIYASLLLTSELKGSIYHPAYYFKNNSDTLQSQLDLVMLTNGWRHFKWDTVLNNKPVAIKYPVEKSQFIAGKIIGYHQPAGDKDQLKIKLIIANEDSSKYIGFVTPDSTGQFILKDYNHQGASKLYFEVADVKNHKKQLKVDFMKSLMDTVNLPGDTIANLSETIQTINPALLNNAIHGQNEQLTASGIVLKVVEIKGKKPTPTELLIKRHVNNFQSEPAYTLDLVNNPSPNIDIVDFMKGRFPGLQIVGNSGRAFFTYHGSNTLMGTSDSSAVGGAYLPYFYMNESHISFDDLQDIQLSNIAMIRFFPPPVWFAPYNGGNVGALVIYTKKQGDDKTPFVSKESFDQYIFNGYSLTREFYSPDYSQKTNFQSDSRSTLYWNYDLDTNSSGEVKFHFYNSDKAKKYRVIIQGMDASGRLGYLDEVF